MLSKTTKNQQQMDFLVAVLATLEWTVLGVGLIGVMVVFMLH